MKEVYFRVFPKFKEYQELIKEATEILTGTGREILLDKKNKNMAFLPQNQIATLMKTSLTEINNNGLIKHVVNFVHDSLWLSCDEETALKIKDTMEKKFRKLIPEGQECKNIEFIKLNKIGGKK